MTKNQLSAAIKVLLERCDSSLKQAQQYTMDSIPNSPSWTVHMTTSVVLAGIVDALIAARDIPEDPDAQSKT